MTAHHWLNVDNRMFHADYALDSWWAHLIAVDGDRGDARKLASVMHSSSRQQATGSRTGQ